MRTKRPTETLGSRTSSSGVTLVPRRECSLWRLLSSTTASLALNLGLPAAEPQALQCGCGYMGSAMMSAGLPVLPSYDINTCFRLFNHVTVYCWLLDTDWLMASGEGNDLGESCVECLSKFMPSQNYKQKYLGPILEGFGLFYYKIKPEQEFRRPSSSSSSSHDFRTRWQSLRDPDPVTVEERAVQRAYLPQTSSLPPAYQQSFRRICMPFNLLLSIWLHSLCLSAHSLSKMTVFLSS